MLKLFFEIINSLRYNLSSSFPIKLENCQPKYSWLPNTHMVRNTIVSFESSKHTSSFKKKLYAKKICICSFFYHLYSIRKISLQQNIKFCVKNKTSRFNIFFSKYNKGVNIIITNATPKISKFKQQITKEYKQITHIQ